MVILGLLLAGAIIWAPFRDIALVLCAVVVLAGSPSHALGAIFAGWLLTSLNPGIYGGNPAPALRWLLIASVVVRVSFRERGRVGRVISDFPGLLVLAAAIVGSALMADDELVGLVLARGSAFVIGLAGLLSFLTSMAREGSSGARSWLYSTWAFILVASAPLVFLEQGYQRNELDFQGVLDHPQSLGIVLAPMVAVTLIRHFVSRHAEFANTMLLIGSLTMLILTRARVGILAAGLGVLGGLVAVSIAHRRQSSPYSIRWDKVVGTLVLSVVLFATSAVVRGALSDYVLRGLQDGVWTAVYDSRGFRAEDSLTNFADSPLFGIGFGLPSDSTIRLEPQESILGFPISAPIEKGVSFTAILEEIGIVGLVGIASVVLVVLRRSWWNPFALTLVLSALLTTFGEATLTSLGGHGLYIWMMVALAAIAFPGLTIINGDEDRTFVVDSAPAT